MKKVIKENKVLFVLALIVIISLILMGVGLIKYFYSTNGNKYGDRLTGIEKHKLKSSLANDIKALYEGGVESVSVDTKGKIVYVIMDVSDGVSKVDAQSYAVKALDVFSDDEKSFYDIQFLITCKNASEETTMYPMEGYKNSSNTQIVWTNN